MPTDMPQGQKPVQDVVAQTRDRVSRALNWAALFVGFGLCFWALNDGMLAPGPNSPSLSTIHALHE